MFRIFVSAVFLLALQADAVLQPNINGSIVAVRATSARSLEGHFPVYSSLFKAPENPFHMTVASLVARGAVLQPQALLINLFKQGVAEGNAGNGGSAIYIATGKEPSYVFSCKYFAAKGCNADGRILHVPQGAMVQASSDHHIIVADLSLGGEIDGWGGGNGSGADGHEAGRCVIDKGAVDCSWAGFFPFSGKGLDGNTGNSADNSGYAMGLFIITADELLSGKIEHALGLNTRCLDDPPVYPADTSKGTDAGCNAIGSENHSPAPRYGSLLHLTWSVSKINSSDYSKPCKTILTALETYGAYTYDAGNNGLALAIENGSAYASPNPYFERIYPAMVSSGDGSGTGSSFRWSSCLNRLNDADFEIYHIPNLGF